MFYIPRATFREDGNQAGVTLLRHTVNGWQVMLLPACSAKCEVKSRVSKLWKESFVASADWCIPLGPKHLLLWRKRFDSWVIIRTVSLPNIFKQPSVLLRISEVERCTVPLMAITYAVFCKKPLVRLTHPAQWRLLCLCPCLRACLMAVTCCLLQQRSDCCSCNSLIMTAGVLQSRFYFSGKNRL